MHQRRRRRRLCRRCRRLGHVYTFHIRALLFVQLIYYYYACLLCIAFTTDKTNSLFDQIQWLSAEFNGGLAAKTVLSNFASKSRVLRQRKRHICNAADFTNARESTNNTKNTTNRAEHTHTNKTNKVQV